MKIQHETFSYNTPYEQDCLNCINCAYLYHVARVCQMVLRVCEMIEQDCAQFASDSRVTCE